MEKVVEKISDLKMTGDAKTDPAFVPKTVRGSCHCGNITYLATFQLPTASALEKYETPQKAHEAANGQRMYKCNCTTCHKLGFFHGRPIDPPNSFYVLSPIPPPDSSSTELGPNVGKYSCFEKVISWYFCQNCGTSPFAVAGETEVIEKEIDVPVKTEDGSYKVEKQTRRVWHISGKSNVKGKVYCTINMTSIDQDQPWFDLRKLNDIGCFEYLDWLSDNMERSAKPFPGGMY